MGEKWTAFKNITWCIIDDSVQPAVFRCLRCGEIEEVSYPISINDYVIKSKKFCKKHNRCKNQEGMSTRKKPGSKEVCPC